MTKSESKHNQHNDARTPEQRERCRRLAEKTAPYHPDDSLVDYDEPRFRGEAPSGWSKRLG